MTVPRCVLALDLGTSTFKAGIVVDGTLVGEPSVVPYKVDTDRHGRVTCPPMRYRKAAFDAIQDAAATAADAGLAVDAIGVCSQAQTFVALDAQGRPMGRAIVWTDNTAEDEAIEAANALSGFARTSGFCGPDPAQLLPKVMRAHRADQSAARYLLLNEFIIRELTGEAFGDETNHGMGGFFDISARRWSEEALALAGISPDHLARVAPAAAISAPLWARIAAHLGLPKAPVYSCGNDQSCSAAGCGVERPGEVACTFGTAMVTYTPTARLRLPKGPFQIAGINPLTARCFLLAYQAGIGDGIQAAAASLYPDGGLSELLREASRDRLEIVQEAMDIPLGLTDKQAFREWQLQRLRPVMARRITDEIGKALCELVISVAGRKPGRLVASGGLAQNADFMRLMEEASGYRFERAAHPHAAMLGVSRIIGARATP